MTRVEAGGVSHAHAAEAAACLIAALARTASVEALRLQPSNSAARGSIALALLISLTHWVLY